MDWIVGMQRAIDYIEAHLTEPPDYEAIAAQSFLSSWHFQRVFSILCGYTVGEYIRNRRLALAGAELAAGQIRVIDAALKYGYESPDSFAKAFRRFHGILPSEALRGGNLRSFSRLVLKFTLEGGCIMNYRMEKKEAAVYTGYRRHFDGTPARRADQERDFYLSTRANQYLLMGLAHDCETLYNIMENFDAEGYDFCIAARLSDWCTENLEREIGEDAARFEKIAVPAGLYLVCETEPSRYPTEHFEELRKAAVSQWLPASGYRLANAPEISVYHSGQGEKKSRRTVELWIPIVKDE